MFVSLCPCFLYPCVPMPNPLHLFDPNYLLDPTPGSANHYYIPLIITFALLMIGGVLCKKYLRQHKKDQALRKLFKNTSRNLMALGIIGLLLIAIRYENLPYLSMRFFLWLLVIITIVFFAKTIYTYIKKYPVEKEKIKKHIEKKKYLPKKKK